MLEGRTAELKRIEELLAAARRGDGGALLLEGEPGIGKTALLAEAEAAATEMTVLRTAGLEAGSSLPFAALRRLLRPLLERRSQLPPVQAQALGAALGLEEGAPPEAVAVPLALLGLLGLAAAERPLLAVVDDLQWLDPASREAVLFAARRLGGRPLALLLAARDGGELPLERIGVERLPLAALAAADARRLLGRAAPALSVPVREAVAAAAAGNPLALVELPRGLSEEQRAGRAPLPSPPRPGPLLEASFSRRLAGLDPAARSAAIVAAAMESGPLSWLLDALAGSGLDSAGLDGAERAGILAVREGEVELRHPLLRAAAYHGAGEEERRAAHRALAATAPDPAQRAWHLAAAAGEADAGIAAALEEAARQAVAVGGHLEAGAAYARAAELSVGAARRGARELEAARNLAVGGEFDRALELIDAAAANVDPAQAAAVEGLRGNLEMRRGDPHAAYRTLTAAGERFLAAGDHAAAAGLFLEATVAPMMTGDLGQQDHVVARALLAAREVGGAPEVLAELVAAELLVMHGRDAEGDAALARVVPRLSEVDPLEHGEIVGMAAQTSVWAGSFDRGEEILAGLVAAFRAARALGRLSYPLTVRSQVAVRRGRWEDAARDGEEAVRLAREIGQRPQFAFALAVRARLQAMRGEGEAARAGIAEALEICEREGAGGIAVHAHAALALAELIDGEPEAALAAAGRAREIEAAAGLKQLAAAMWAAELVEALVALGRTAEAAETVAWLGERAAQSGSAWVEMAARRGEVMLAPEEGIDAAAAAARAAHQRLELPFERARGELAIGERLRRAQRRADSRAALTAALEIFERLGAAPFAARSRVGLEPAAAPAAAAPPLLSTPERRLVELVGEGRTNREIAAELHLGQKTLERRLTALYRKLGVGSRAELLARVGGGGGHGAVRRPQSAK